MLAKFTLSNLISAGLALLAAILVFICYNQFVHKNALRVLVNGVYLADTRIEINSIDEAGNRRHLETLIAKQTDPGQPLLVGTRRLNTPLETLELQFFLANKRAVESNTIVAIHSVQITRPYSFDLFYGANTVYDYFTPSATGSAGLRANLAVKPEFNVLRSNQPITPPDYLGASLLAGLFFFALWFIFRNGDWKNIPAVADMSLGREISSAHEFGSINGIRGIAALLVLLSHTAPGFNALGVGLTLLFVISGFLLSKPFILAPQKIYSLENIEVYITKRLKRILPMYYLYIFMLYVVSLQLDTALRHFLFVQAEGHLWPMTQIFAFYLLLPFLLLITSALHRVHLVLPIVALLAVAIYWLRAMGDWTPFFNGEYYHEFYLYAFLMGVAASYFHYGGLAQSRLVQNIAERARWPLAIAGAVILFFTIAWSAPLPAPQWFAPYISQFWMKSVLSVVIILLALNVRGTFFNSFINNAFFRSMGIVGFSFYILHGLGMQIVLAAQQIFLGIPNPDERSWGFFLASLIVTYFMSAITYSYVERPFFGFKRRKQLEQ